jgi:hypothetical protein
MQVMFLTHHSISRLLLVFIFIFDTLLHLYFFLFTLLFFFFHFRYFEKQSLKVAFASALADPTVGEVRREDLRGVPPRAAPSSIRRRKHEATRETADGPRQGAAAAAHEAAPPH